MNLKKYLLPQLLSLNLHFSTACTFWITICKLKYQSILDIYVRIWIICNDLQNGRHRFQNGWGRLWRISLIIALKFLRDRVWVWGFTSNSIRGVQMLDDAHNRWSCLHDAQGRIGFELARGQSATIRRQNANAKKTNENETRNCEWPKFCIQTREFVDVLDSQT